ncbi:hypothetical protein F3H09_32155 [Pseudomonas aeruginosa]|nr:hypothetical protein F3H09_32155 [Pseudomonas aeruginosa]
MDKIKQITQLHSSRSAIKSPPYQHCSISKHSGAHASFGCAGIGSGSTMRMECGEQLLVLETDAGDGWTRVRRNRTREEGFVPTTYIATTLYSDAQH